MSTAHRSSRFLFSREPNEAYLHLCAQNKMLFHSPAWQQVLQAGFGVHTLYGWDPDNQTCMAIAIFKAAVFRIGYIGFPAAGTLTNTPFDNEMLEAVRQGQYERPIHAIRFTPSPFRDRVTIPEQTEQTWETAVMHLPDWSLDKLSGNIRRDVRKAQRHLQITSAQSPNDAQEMYRLYADTIQRRDGNLRYTQPYFQALVKLAQQNEQVRCLLARFEEETAGFLVVVNNGQTANYLHGAIANHLRKYRASDLLLATAIQWAQAKKMTIFNFMASPLAQQSLVTYKERWGGTTHLQHTFNISTSPLGGWLFESAYKIVRKLQTIRGKK